MSSIKMGTSLGLLQGSCEDVIEITHMKLLGSPAHVNSPSTVVFMFYFYYFFVRVYVCILFLIFIANLFFKFFYYSNNSSFSY